MKVIAKRTKHFYGQSVTFSFADIHKNKFSFSAYVVIKTFSAYAFMSQLFFIEEETALNNTIS